LRLKAETRSPVTLKKNESRLLSTSEKQYQAPDGLSRDCRFFLTRRPRPSAGRFRRPRNAERSRQPNPDHTRRPAIRRIISRVRKSSPRSSGRAACDSKGPPRGFPACRRTARSSTARLSCAGRRAERLRRFHDQAPRSESRFMAFGLPRTTLAQIRGGGVKFRLRSRSVCKFPTYFSNISNILSNSRLEIRRQ
jgi:hypothetical protein